MKKYVVIKTQFSALHNWEDCDLPDVFYLKFMHRHLFHVVMKWEVKNNNREIEFIDRRNDVYNYLHHKYEQEKLPGKSCEDIAEELLLHFKADFVSVFEDNENGAEIYK